MVAASVPSAGHSKSRAVVAALFPAHFGHPRSINRAIVQVEGKRIG
jgi:hypothetical protein